MEIAKLAGRLGRNVGRGSKRSGLIKVTALVFAMSPQNAVAEDCSTTTQIAHDYQKAMARTSCDVFGKIMSLSKSGYIASLMAMRRLPEVEGEAKSYLLTQIGLAIFENAVADGRELTDDDKGKIILSLFVENIPGEEVDTADYYYRFTRFAAFIAALDIFYGFDAGHILWLEMPVDERMTVSRDKNGEICALRNLAPDVSEGAVFYSVDYRMCVQDKRFNRAER